MVQRKSEFIINWKFDYVVVKTESNNFDTSHTLNYMVAGGGASGSHGKTGYEVVLNRYFDVGEDDSLESEFSLNSKVFYHFTDSYSLGAELELFDDAKVYQINGRFNF